MADEPILEAAELPPKKKPVPKKRETKEVKVTTVTEPLPKDTPPEVTLDQDDTTGKFTPLEGAKVLMDVMATIHEGRENYCCAEMYRRQKMPVAVSLNELAKDSPMLQQWITHGKAFKFIALIAATEPLVEHQWRAHLRPSIQQRRAQQEYDYYIQNPDQAPEGYWDNQPIYEPEQAHVHTHEEQEPQPQPFRGHATPTQPGTGPERQPEVIDESEPPTQTKAEFIPGAGVVGGNGAVVPIPQRG